MGVPLVDQLLASPTMTSSSSAPHPWELYDVTHAWDDDSYAGWGESDSEGDREPTAGECGELLAAMLIDLRLKGKLSSKHCCVLAYHASRAGASGPCSKFAMPPNSQSGHFQRKLDKYLETANATAHSYHLDVPGHSKHEAARCVHKLPVIPPHEALDREVLESPTLARELVESCEKSEWAANYLGHPVVQRHPPGSVYPLVLYLDGVPFTKHDGFLAFWIYNLISNKRHLLAILRKSDMCACGCKRWCSLQPIYSWLHWSLAALGNGIMPSHRHDGSAFGADEDHRSLLAGSTIAKGAIVMIKGDWAEFALSLGFPTWAHATHPCPFCVCRKSQMFIADNLSPISFPFPLKTHEGYLEACRVAEHWVLVTEVDRAALLVILRYDKRDDGSRGRALIENYPPLFLEKGDRLEPSMSLNDVAQFESLGNLPQMVLFWKLRTQTWAHHRNPLFAGDIGVSIDSLAIDTLHTLNLGLYQKFVATVWWALLLSDAFNVAGSLGNRNNQAELVATGCLRLRHELMTWYKQYQREHPTSSFSKLTDLVVKTLGDRDKQNIKTKAAETRPLISFCKYLLAKFVVPAASLPLVGACDELLRFIAVMKRSPRRMSPSQIQDRKWKQTCINYLSLFRGQVWVGSSGLGWFVHTNQPKSDREGRPGSQCMIAGIVRLSETVFCFGRGWGR